MRVDGEGGGTPSRTSPQLRDEVLDPWVCGSSAVTLRHYLAHKVTRKRLVVPRACRIRSSCSAQRDAFTTSPCLPCEVGIVSNIFYCWLLEALTVAIRGFLFSRLSFPTLGGMVRDRSIAEGRKAWRGVQEPRNL